VRVPGYQYVSFTTDYGLSDGFVAACHGAAWTVAPHVRLLDITHLVPPGDVRRGALVLAQTVPDLPDYGAHVAVVDPGVGTARRGIAVATTRAVLVGPDNGLLLPAAAVLGGILRAVELTRASLFRQPVSRTFHGRDIFAPVAAHLARGVDFASLGPAVAEAELVRLDDPVLRRGDGWLEAEVLTVDHFGNVQLAAGQGELDALGGDRVRVGDVDATVRSTFGAVPSGELVVYLDSAGHLAIAVNGGSAADKLVTGAGAVLRLTTSPPG
jgi:hypothetical protein